MIKNKINSVKVLKEEINQQYVDTIKDVNSSTTECYNTLSKVSTEMSTVINKVTVLGDMLTDLRVLNGTAKTIHYLSNQDIVENKGLKIKNDKFILDNSNSAAKEINSAKSSISSLEAYKLLTVNNKPAYLEDFIKTNSEIKVEFNNPYTFTLNLMFDSPQQINSIDLQLGIGTVSYPTIMSIKYVDSLNTIKETIILDNNSRAINLDEDRVLDNLYTINTNPIVTDQLFIELSSRDYSEITLKSIKTYHRTSVQSGYMIVGPIHSEDPILKLAIDSEEISDGVSFEISSDLEYWLPIVNSSSTAENGGKKILSFNTVNIDSIKTEEDLYSFYVKVILTSKEVTNEDLAVPVYNTLREDSAISNDTLSLVNDNLFSAYRVKNSDFVHGSYMYTSSLNNSKLSLDKVEYIEKEGQLKVLGLVDTKYSVTNSNIDGLLSGSVGAELKLLRLDANKVIDARNFDLANSVVMDVYPRYITSSINSKQKDNMCLVLKRKRVEDDEILFTPPYDIEVDFNTIDESDLIWNVDEGIVITEGSARYTATRLNLDGGTYNSFADLNLETALIRSFSDTGMQQWQGFKDAVNELTGVTDWVVDASSEKILYQTHTTISEYRLQNGQSIVSDSFSNACLLWDHTWVGSSDVAVRYDPEPSNCVAYRPLDDGVMGFTYIYLLSTNTESENKFLSFFTLIQKILSNTLSTDQGTSLLAEAYIEEVANSIHSEDETKQFVKLSDLTTQFEQNKTLGE